MLCYLGICFFAGAVFCLYRSWTVDASEENVERETQATANLPYVAELNKFRKRKYDYNHQNQTHASTASLLVNKKRETKKSNSKTITCSYCFKRFKHSDTVVDCVKNHVFHDICFE